jgi:hypothetical protein
MLEVAVKSLADTWSGSKRCGFFSKVLAAAGAVRTVAIAKAVASVLIEHLHWLWTLSYVRLPVDARYCS